MSHPLGNLLYRLLRIPARLFDRGFRALGAAPSLLQDRRVLISLAIFAPFLLASYALLVYRPQPDVAAVEAKVRDALDALDSEDLERACALANEVHGDSALSYEAMGGPIYVLGAALAYDAESHSSSAERRRRHLLASRYLEEAKRRGFPAGREGEGRYLLARAVFLAGKYTESGPLLEAAVEVAPEHANELYGYLATAYYLDDNPQLDKAKRYSDKYLEDPLLAADERARGQLMLARILYRQGEYEPCRKLLESLEGEGPEVAADSLVMQGQMLIEEAERQAKPVDGQPAPSAEANLRYQAAIEKLRDARVQLRRTDDAARVGQFLLAVAYRRTAQNKAAAEQFAQVRRKHYGTDEGQAASLFEADSLRDIDRDDEAVDSYLRVLADVGPPATYVNPRLSLSQLRSSVNEALLHYVQKGEYPRALKLALAMSPAFPSWKSIQAQAEVHRQWAQDLDAKIPSLPSSQAEQVRQEARQHWREAGRTFADLAAARVATRTYPDDLLNSVESYLQGQDYRAAVRMIVRLERTQSVKNRPRVLVARGAALLALNRLDEAIVPLKECLKRYPKSPSTYDARLVLSDVQLEKGNLPEAKSLLSENIHGDLTPESAAWRDSLFALGRILFLDGSHEEAQSRAANLLDATAGANRNREMLKHLEIASAAYKEAIRWLLEAVTRWPNDSKTVLARYMMAKAHQQRARLPEFRLPLEQIETTKDELEKERRTLLDQAQRTYHALEIDLDKKQDTTELSDVEKSVLRNCYFAQADALFQMGQFEDAIQAYSSASNRYQHEPESLEAFVQIATCYRRLDNPEKARGTLEQAKVVLQRMRPDADFSKTTTRKDAEAWKDYLDWLSQI